VGGPVNRRGAEGRGVPFRAPGGQPLLWGWRYSSVAGKIVGGSFGIKRNRAHFPES